MEIQNDLRSPHHELVGRRRAKVLSAKLTRVWTCIPMTFHRVAMHSRQQWLGTTGAMIGSAI